MRTSVLIAALAVVLVLATPTLASQLGDGPLPSEDEVKDDLQRTEQEVDEKEKTVADKAESHRADLERRVDAVEDGTKQTLVVAKDEADEALGGVGQQADATAGEAEQAVREIVGWDARPTDGKGEHVGADQDDGAPLPGMGDRIAEALSEEITMAGIVGSTTAGLGALAFGVVTRYVSPKEALKNPQRSMLYGFVRAQPGAHLKQVAEEFQMKTSSILWHMRKLESAGLVQSERANGFRVFYPVEGGIEIKRVSRALTALQNGNARSIFDMVSQRPGQTTRNLSDHLSIHVGTVRWHLRKLREFGLVDELVREDGSMFYPTPLGNKALEAAMGRATTAETGRGRSAPVTADA